MMRDPIRVIRRAAPVLLATGLSATAAVTAGNENAARFFESLEVPLVSIEVIATDRDGAPVLDLTADDFEVFEDGRPVEISHFSRPEQISVDGGGAEGTPRPLPAVPERDVYLALYFDDYNVDPRVRGSALAQLRSHLQGGLPAGVKGMVVRFDGRLIVECEPTASAERVLHALDRVQKHVPLDLSRDGERLVNSMQTDSTDAPRVGPRDIFGEGVGVVSGGLRNVLLSDYMPQIHHYVSQRYHRGKDSLEGLESFVRHLQGLHGHKAVVWVGSIETRVGENLFRTYQALFPQQAFADGVNPMMEAMKYDLTHELRDVVQLASSHRVSFYPLGAFGSGVDVNFEYRNEIIAGAGQPARMGPDDSRAIADALEVMARSTGGQTLRDGHLDRQLAVVAQELGASYSLAYRPPSTGDRRYHRIKVAVRPEGVVLRHRQGYRVSKTADRLADRTLTAALLGVTENPLGIDINSRQVEARDDGLFLVPVAVEIPIGNLVLTPAAEQHVARVSVLSVVRDQQGRLSDIHEREYPITIDNDRLLATVNQRATVVLGMVLRGGPHRISIGVRDVYSSIASTGYVEVSVPGPREESAG